MNDLPGIRVTCREAHEAVGEVIGVHECTKSAAHIWRLAHGTSPIADDSLGDKGSEVVVVSPRDTFHSNRNVRRRNSVVTDADFRANELRLALLLCCDLRGVGCWGTRSDA